MYVYIYICIFIYLHTYIHIYIYIYIYVYVYVYIYIYIYVYMYFSAQNLWERRAQRRSTTEFDKQVQETCVVCYVLLWRVRMYAWWALLLLQRSRCVQRTCGDVRSVRLCHHILLTRRPFFLFRCATVSQAGPADEHAEESFDSIFCHDARHSLPHAHRQSKQDSTRTMAKCTLLAHRYQQTLSHAINKELPRTNSLSAKNDEAIRLLVFYFL